MFGLSNREEGPPSPEERTGGEGQGEEVSPVWPMDFSWRLPLGYGINEPAFGRRSGLDAYICNVLIYTQGEDQRD